MGQKMHKTHESKKTTEAGYIQHLSHYQAKNCESCPLRGQCFKGKANRSIERNHNLERHKQKIRELLTSEKGLQKRKQRTADVEPVFAQLKHNHNFRRSEEHTSELQSRENLVCRLLLEQKNHYSYHTIILHLP